MTIPITEDRTWNIIKVDKGKGLKTQVRLFLRDPSNAKSDLGKVTVCFEKPEGSDGLDGDYSVKPIQLLVGPRKNNNFEIHGWGIEELIAAAYLELHRYETESEGIPCVENKIAMSHLEAAFNVMQDRMEDREKRGVLGENKE